MKTTIFRVIVVLLGLALLGSILLFILSPQSVNIAYAMTVVTSFLSLLIIYFSKGTKQNNNK